MATQVIQERFSAQRPVPLSRRAATLALVIAIHAAILWLMLHIAPAIMSPPPGPEDALVVDMLPADRVAPAAQPAQKAQRKAAAGAASSPQPVARTAPPPDIPPPPPVPTAPSSNAWSRVIPMTGRDFARAAIAPGAKVPADSNAGAGDAAGDSGDGDSPSDAGGGSGGGERLYAADWYRRPTHAELSTYLPRRAQPGWGEVACRTIPNNQVTDCREIGQSSRGSGLAGAVRQAAWQFRIVPPRVGGRPMVGTWVRIRITYSDRGAAIE